MQTIYSFKGGESDNFDKEQKFLIHSLDNIYNLYLLMISLLIELQKKAEDHAEKTSKKLLATKEEKNFNKKLVNNEALLMLKNNVLLQDELEERKISNWELDSEYVDIIFRQVLASDLYEQYMQTKTSTFKEDKDFVVDVFTEIIAPNEKLYDYLEDKNLTWIDDLPVVNTAILKLLRKVKKDSLSTYFIPKLYKDIADKEYAINLFKKTLLNQSKFSEVIQAKTQNWDAERIASIDTVLLQMAICEIQKFPSIPVKVTINEYLEIAKEYSTPKSSVFINGILDKLIKEYQESNSLNKTGRGLM
ncbi:transcription antitermination factor NusB [Xanthomarina sp. F1114]|uniref:transcription antitermination factor NusB n=1 Tax=Xanthomarina sp. F1114 TaxID=2996019 RepID=UPI00225E38E3|nr:transcription antitermination factor NusB [Xanthomarina sp. F1114]MCX7547530.1 transcription antitermination factor NusB [Xanthomarina sp. F1114]